MGVTEASKLCGGKRRGQPINCCGMVARTTSPLGRFVDGLPGWVFLLAGAALTAAPVLMPGYLTSHEMAWQRDLLAAQARALNEEQPAYRQLNDALNERDPALLERVAFHYLHLKPADKTLLVDEARLAAQQLGTIASTGNPLQTAMGVEFSSTVESWVKRPVPRVGVDWPAYSAPNTRLLRISAGRSGIVLAAAGLMLIAAGLVYRREEQPEPLPTHL